MRKDCHIDPARWIREYRQALKLGDVALKVLIYSETGPESHRTGLYHVSDGTVASMVGEPIDVVARAFEDLETAGLLMRDADAGLVYLPDYCERQFAWKDKATAAKDWRVIEARRHIARLPASHHIKKPPDTGNRWLLGLDWSRRNDTAACTRSIPTTRSTSIARSSIPAASSGSTAP